MPIVYMTRKESFSAAHKLYSNYLTAEENQELYSKCTNCHGHNYIVEVQIRAPIDSKTGMAMNISVLKDCMKKVIDKLDHKNLDIDVDYFKDNVSTTENLCVYVWNELSKFSDLNSTLYEVKIYETSNNSFIYRGEI